MSQHTIHVLLIEDNPADARLIHELLREGRMAHFQVNHVDRLSDGLAACARGGVDVVLADLSLPDSAGLATFERIRDCARDVPVVVMTGMVDEEQALKAVRGGADDYIVKGAPEGDMLGRALRYAVERRRAARERIQLEAQVRHTQKLESLGVLAGGIAHDFNNLLMGVLGHASLALMDLAPGAPARESVEQIEAAALRAAELTRQLLAYSGKARFVKQQLDVSRVIEEMAHLLETVASKKVELKLDLEMCLPPVTGDPSQMEQVLLNLVANGAEAIGNASGTIVVSTSLRKADAEFLAGTRTMSPNDQEAPKPGTYLCMRVQDTGCGMDEGTLERLFDPFFSTKATGRGLGLAAVMGIVRAHGGAIAVRSARGEGSTFDILLPIAKEEPKALALEEQRPQPQKGAVVLVVDDEEYVRAIARRVLEREGYPVLTACDGLEAVEVFSREPDRVSCVILDMTMPRMDGREALRELRNIRCDVPVIVSSGYDENEAAARFADEGLAGFLQKPYRPNALIGRVQEALGA